MTTIRAISTLAILAFGTALVVGCGADKPVEPKGGSTSHLEGDEDSYQDEGSSQYTGGDDDRGTEDGDRYANGGDQTASGDADQERDVAAVGPVIVGIVVVACVSIPYTCPTWAKLSCGAAGVKSAEGQCNVGLSNAGISCKYECNPTSTG